MTKNSKEKLTSTQSARQKERIGAESNGEMSSTSHQARNQTIKLGKPKTQKESKQRGDMRDKTKVTDHSKK